VPGYIDDSFFCEILNHAYLYTFGPTPLSSPFSPCRFSISTINSPDVEITTPL
jgi:hypothetical protein